MKSSTPIYDSIVNAQRLAREGVIFAPSGFIYADPLDLLEYCNGCGAAGSSFRPPSTIYGTSIEEACHVHDYMYYWGLTASDKDNADNSFDNNMRALIMRDRHKWYKPTFLQLWRADKYYQAVVMFGGDAFWEGKK